MNSQSDANHRFRRGAIIIGAAALAVVVAAGPVLGAKATTRSSLKTAGGQAGAPSGEAAISENGRYVAFYSVAKLVNPGNGLDHCYVRDHKGKSTERVSVSSAEVLGNGDCYGPDISDSGRFVAFESMASNLIAGDGNGTWDIFVRDRTAGTTEIVSVDKDGNDSNGPSRDPAISGDGRFVVFESSASDLVGKDTNGKVDVFMYDRKLDNTTRLSVRSTGKQGNGHSFDPDISSDGRWVVFESKASNLIKRDSNGKQDIFIYSRAYGTTKRVSKKSGGGQANGGSANPTVSGNGRYVAFQSKATNLAGRDRNKAADVFVHDRKKNKTRRISVKNGGGAISGWSYDPAISDNGRWVAFTSTSSQLVKRDTNKLADVFVHDRWKTKNQRVSVRTGGAQAKGGKSDEVKISGNGKYVAFESAAKNLVRNDTNKLWDVFRRGPLY